MESKPLVLSTLIVNEYPIDVWFADRNKSNQGTVSNPESNR